MHISFHISNSISVIFDQKIVVTSYKDDNQFMTENNE